MSSSKRSLASYADVFDDSSVAAKALTALSERKKKQKKDADTKKKAPARKQTAASDTKRPLARKYTKEESGAKEKVLRLKTVEKRVVCKYWMEGTCAKGASCPFSHAITPNRTPEQVREANSAVPCKYFLAGACAKGSECLFSHDLAAVPCRFWHGLGSCAAGAKCKFSHDPVADDVKAEIMLQMRAASNSESEAKAEADERADTAKTARRKDPALVIDYTQFRVPRVPVHLMNDEQ